MKKLWERYPQIRTELDQFEEYFLSSLTARQPLIKEAIGDLAKAGGKRIRPALVLATAQFGKTGQKDILSVAAAVEIMHMATLVHDDIIDESNLRRGIPTTQAKYGKDIAVFTGDYLFAQAFILLAEEQDTEYLRRIAKSIKYICEGEIDQYENRYNLNVSLLKYFRRIRRKTAILFQASCFSGGFKAKLTKKQQYVLSKYGKYLGMIFQITDDILDVASTEEMTGKPVGNDFCQGVYTLPVIFALQDEKVGPELRAALAEDVVDKEKVLSLVRSTDAIERTKGVVEMYAAKARHELRKLPPIKAVNFMEDLLDYMAARLS